MIAKKGAVGRWTESTYEIVLNLRAQGMSLREIGEIFDVGPERIRQVVAKAKRRAGRLPICADNHP